jgi:cyclopropane-fatty-acyl-phospholipid synthase
VTGPAATASSGASPGASPEAIQHHYDVSNEFFRLWLDENMVYSCALYDREDELAPAQLAKIDYHVANARAAGAARVLDIGCGWGANLRRLTEHHGVASAVGLTLSRNQAAWIGDRGWRGVGVQVESWADHEPVEPYDAIISVGAFEHFARHDASQDEKVAGYRVFFERCHRWLRPGGYIALQTIAYGNARRSDFSPFFASEVFPESDLPRLSDIAAAVDLRFQITSLRDDREHYERTMQQWRRALRDQRAAAVAMVGERAYHRYDRMCAMFGIGFHIGSMSLLRLALRRIDEPVDRR